MEKKVKETDSPLSTHNLRNGRNGCFVASSIPSSILIFSKKLVQALQGASSVHQDAGKPLIGPPQQEAEAVIG